MPLLGILNGLFCVPNSAFTRTRVVLCSTFNEQKARYAVRSGATGFTFFSGVLLLLLAWLGYHCLCTPEYQVHSSSGMLKRPNLQGGPQTHVVSDAFVDMWFTSPCTLLSRFLLLHHLPCGLATSFCCCCWIHPCWEPFSGLRVVHLGRFSSGSSSTHLLWAVLTEHIAALCPLSHIKPRRSRAQMLACTTSRRVSARPLCRGKAPTAQAPTQNRASAAGHHARNSWAVVEF